MSESKQLISNKKLVVIGFFLFIGAVWISDKIEMPEFNFPGNIEWFTIEDDDILVEDIEEITDFITQKEPPKEIPTFEEIKEEAQEEFEENKEEIDKVIDEILHDKVEEIMQPFFKTFPEEIEWHTGFNTNLNEDDIQALIPEEPLECDPVIRLYKLTESFDVKVATSKIILEVCDFE